MSVYNSVDESIQKLELDGLIGSRMSELGLRPSELVRRWGYANTSKGMRRLGQLRTGQFTPDLQGVSALARALEVPVEDVLKAIQTTQQQLEQSSKRAEEQEWREWCSRFQPHAIIKTDQPRPSPIFVAAILGPERLLRLDFDLGRPPVTWPFQVSERLPDRVPAFGKVNGFYLNYSPERAVEFDRTGQALREYPAARRPGRAWMEHKGRDVTPAWRAAI
jgi:hypothetical protein